MNRTVGLMVLCVALGAAAMYGGSNFRVRVEPVAPPPQTPHLPHTAEPARLPEGVTGVSRAAPRYDPHVRPVVGEADEPGAIAVSRVTETVTGAGTSNTAVWKYNEGPPALITRQAKVEFEKALPTTENMKVLLQGTVLNDPVANGVTLAPDKKSITFDFEKGSLEKYKGTVGIRVEDSKDDKPVTVAAFRLRVPTKLATAEQRVILSGYGTAPNQETLVTDASTDVKVYATARNGTFLTLKGSKLNASDPKVIVQAGDDPITTLSTAPVGATAASGWYLRVTNLPAMPPSVKAFVAVRGEFGDGEHAYATNRLVLAPQAIVDRLDAPGLKVELPTGAKATDKINEDTPAGQTNPKVYYTNTPNLKVTVTSADANAGAVLLYVDTNPVPLVMEVGGKGSQEFPVALTAGRDHVIQAALARGEAVSDTRAQADVRLRTVGPTVDSVVAPGFGQSNGQGVEKVAIRFNSENPLNKTSAATKANYEVRHNENTTERGDLIDGNPVYDPITNTVTLSVKGVLPGSYRIAVKTNLEDKFGNKAAQGTGLDTDYAFVTTIFALPGDQLPSQTAGVTLQTGPAVPLAEYLNPRPPVEGFNPSDRVEARVVRLYYYRDAHRVAQLINRTVKSYNAASVDVRRRAADRGRDDADRSTDERKRLEGVAVRAAQEARAAEAELNNLQNNSATARTQAAAARIDLGQLEQQLVQARRDAERAQAVTTPVAATDPAVLNQRQRVTQFEAQSVVLKQQLKDADTELNTATNTKTSADAAAASALATADAKKVVAQKSANNAKALQSKADDLAKLAATDANQKAAAEAAKGEAERANVQKNADALAADDAKVDSDAAAVVAARAAAAVREAATKKNALQIQSDALDRTIADERLVLARVEAESRNRSETGTDPTQKRVRALEEEIAKRRLIIQNGDAVDQSNAARIAAAQQNVAVKREAEARTLEAWQVKELEERRLRENQFRVEVAAAKADPDTYGPADPDSVDPVLRTSISVIGEGLIQIRGPIKGLNAIRTMVNQIDSPVGQVRISVHTLQVNGERGDRMEKVIANIQRYLDHSRFLTAQSAQMLRYAVTSVAARKATEIEAQLPPGCTQWHRDQKYLYAFFGKDFVDELTQLDSEFLKTGNKLLSFNSMDSTSLSAALFLMALAKNDVRTEILNEFLGLVQGKLPDAELQYYAAGVSDPKCCDACKDKKLYLLAYNSKFQSLLGFFNADIAGTDTLSPLQREFIRLAQIFKARMITELQLSQRVKERALLEERVGAHYLKDLQEAFDLEKKAKEDLRELQDKLLVATARAEESVVSIVKAIQNVQQNLAEDVELFERLSANVWGSNLQTTTRYGGAERPLPKIEKTLGWQKRPIELKGDLAYIAISAGRIKNRLEQFEFINDAYRKIQGDLLTVLADVLKAKDPSAITPEQIDQINQQGRQLYGVIQQETAAASRTAGLLMAALTGERQDPIQAATIYFAFRDDLLPKTRGDTRQLADRLFRHAEGPFRELARVGGRYDAALKKAQAARRPLDEKKLLDMLVDEMEDKFVEILEGTRAHTANIDNYMKSVATALDDDFNTQYYLPSFRRAREASRYWDVTLGQIETTTILTNNRAFGKVSPAATFEFDLPKREILITEGFRSAKALIDEYGALVNDPSFLALAKMASGNPVSMMNNTGGGLSAVRNVLPGLPSSADETIMAQAGPGRKEFGSALEALIPDPAIYKFETGTGFEIRPVLSPDGQSVVFEFDYMYTTDVREPVRADEKHLGRVRRHFVHTDVQLGNFELREVSKYLVALKASRTGRGVQLLQDIPVAGALFRPLPSAASSLQQNLIYSQATIFPTLFDLMGLRYAPAIADLDPLADRLAEFAARNRRLDLEQRIYDGTAARVDEAVRIPYGERRMDLYRPQVSIPAQHPNGYVGPGLRLRDGHLIEGYDPRLSFPETRNAPSVSPEGRSKPLNPNVGYPPPFSPDAIPGGPYPPGYPVPGGPWPPAVVAPPPGPPGSYGSGGSGAPPHPLTNPTPVYGTGMNGARPPAVQPNGSVVPPNYARPLPGGAPIGSPRPQPGTGAPTYPPPSWEMPAPTYPPPSWEMPATQQPPVVRPAVPTGPVAPRPAGLPQLPALPQPVGTPGLAPLPTLQPGAAAPPGALPRLPALPAPVPPAPVPIGR